MNQPHKFAALIKAWADGATIEVRTFNRHAWETLGAVGEPTTPTGMEGCEYRIKPEPQYPVTRMTKKEMFSAAESGFKSGDKDVVDAAYRYVANAAIRRAIEDGDVVLPGEKQ